MTIRVEHYDGLNRTPALLLATRGYLELLENGLCDQLLNVSWEHQALVAFEGVAPVGVLTFVYQAWAKQIDIAIGYVIPDRRRYGVHNAMWIALVAKAKELKATHICSGTHIDNAAMRAVAKKQGRKEIGVALRFTVPEC